MVFIQDDLYLVSYTTFPYIKQIDHHLLTTFKNLQPNPLIFTDSTLRVDRTSRSSLFNRFHNLSIRKEQQLPFFYISIGLVFTRVHFGKFPNWSLGLNSCRRPPSLLSSVVAIDFLQLFGLAVHVLLPERPTHHTAHESISVPFGKKQALKNSA